MQSTSEMYMRNVSLDEAQAEIKNQENINNLWYTQETTLMEESEEELKSHLMRVKEHLKYEDHGIQSYHFMANRWRESGNW